MDNVLSPEKLTHTWLEDALALLFGTLMISFGIILFRQAGALTGGTAGMAFLIHYATHLPFGVVFFAINLPFYWLSVRRMGAAFTLKTFCAVGLVSLFSDLHGYFIHVDRLNPYYATLFGNIMVGIGFVVLFRHKASLGGVNILGGSGSMPGVIIAAFLMGLVTFGLSLLNVPGIVMSVIIGAMLIVVISLPIMARRMLQRRRC
ncbi:hypothetical protein SB00610_03678 [Klebsiella quasipneumoniae subsp. similipneumoniae]|nr:hypothetical protein SB00610_03678 [Klebsiella quasipneumoniae subsp. similipneumoniae]